MQLFALPCAMNPRKTWRESKNVPTLDFENTIPSCQNCSRQGDVEEEQMKKIFTEVCWHDAVPDWYCFTSTQWAKLWKKVQFREILLFSSKAKNQHFSHTQMPPYCRLFEELKNSKPFILILRGNHSTTSTSHVSMYTYVPTIFYT